MFKKVLHAQVNGEKFVSKERLTGLNLCRELDKNGNIINKQYTYNEPLKSLVDSQTADMLTYGLAGTVTGATFSQKSHVIEGYTYSLEPYELMNRETHNTLYESGTMLNESGKQSESFFHPVKIQPGTHFVHFVTLEAGTKEMLLYIIHNILNTGRYGARETRTGRNIRNEVIGLITSSNDSSLSCGELICEQLGKVDNNLKLESIKSAISNYVNAHKKSDWQIYWSSNFFLENPDKYPEWLLNLINVGERKSQSDLELLASALEIIRKQGLDVVEKNEFLLKEKDIIDPIQLARRLLEEMSPLSNYIMAQLSSDTISLAESG
jgi:CRISPR-associated protein Csc2